MHKNQLQELAQRSCFNLPSYSCIREGPDHAPRFKATVTFNGDSFESPGFFNTLRQAEHAAAEVALNTLSKSGPNQSLAARILDETGVCKNLLQETAQRAGVKLPVYIVERSGPGHMPVFVSTVELAGMNFTGEPAKTKKQAEKNAAMSAWASIKQLISRAGSSSDPADTNEEQMQIIAARFLMNYQKDQNTISPQRSPTKRTQAVVHSPQQSPIGTRTITVSPQPRSPIQSARPLTQNIKITPLPENSPRSMEARSPIQSARPLCQNIKITPLPETSPRSMEARSPIPSARPLPKNIKITPLPENSPRSMEALPCYNSSSWTEVDGNPGHSPQSQTELGSIKSCESSGSSHSSSIKSPAQSRINANRVGHTFQPMPMQVHAMPVNPGSDPHATVFTVTQLSHNEKSWFQGGPSTIIISAENGDAHHVDKAFPLVTAPYNQMVWSPGNQWVGMLPRPQVMPAFKPATSLAPVVRVRQSVPVCSAPPVPKEKQNMVTKAEEETRVALDQLKL